ncbi:hypothetical protein AXG93_2145s1570 [Marchantia polymorpha subsp. ruderalis]|uniref:Endonuclease/exonuclease/phosphatase domain-containing protein n=1 Tax=Marchantia polymorpha subsp. ruderalis TaxID=1480154 RepID=A0A176VYH5_MARPO|nr:hypothetical protein AXG93_2145s1570 [Marchantia polymorpha subsp. ruderalis]
MDVAEEQNTSTSPAPQARKARATLRAPLAEPVEAEANEAGSKRKPATDREPNRRRAKVAKSGSTLPGAQIEIGGTSDQLTQSLFPLQPKQLLRVLAQRDSTEPKEPPSEQVQQEKAQLEEKRTLVEEKVQGALGCTRRKEAEHEDFGNPQTGDAISKGSSKSGPRHAQTWQGQKLKRLRHIPDHNRHGRKYKVKDFIGNSRDKPDVIAVQEHKLDVFAMTAIGHLLSRDLHTICSPGYKGVRGEGTGGTALLIHRSFKIIKTGTSEDGYVTWAQIEKGGHKVYIALVYGPHSLGARAAHWAQLRNMFPHTNIILCGDWNMVECPTDSSRECQVLGGAQDLTFTELRTKHNLQDLRTIVAETRGPLHTRWSAYEGDPRWARLDRIYFSHGGRWLAAAHYLHHVGNTLSDHLLVSASVEVGTVDCTDGRLSLMGPITFNWSPSLLGKPQIQERVKRIWGKLEQRIEDPRKIYHKGTT